MGGLPNASRAQCLAGANTNVCTAVNSGQEAGYLLYRHREVHVAQKDRPAAAASNPKADRAALASSREMEPVETTVLRGRSVGDG